MECTEGSTANTSSERSYGPDAADRQDWSRSSIDTVIYIYIYVYVYIYIYIYIYRLYTDADIHIYIYICIYIYNMLLMC